MQDTDRQILQESSSNRKSDIQFRQASPVHASESNVIEKSRTKSEKSVITGNQIHDPVQRDLRELSQQKNRQSGTQLRRTSSVLISKSIITEKSSNSGEKSEITGNRIHEILPQKLQKSSKRQTRESEIQLKQTSPVLVSKSNIVEKSQKKRERSLIARNRLRETRSAIGASSLFSDSDTGDAIHETRDKVSAADLPLSLTDSSDEDESTIYVRQVNDTHERIFLPTPKLGIL
uniref:Uncharacterized protein n=1 Tax=Romanomermis culicivorax TaxID=13658 RepID=A0A915JUJ2_ROMCU